MSFLAIVLLLDMEDTEIVTTYEEMVKQYVVSQFIYRILIVTNYSKNLFSHVLRIRLYLFRMDICLVLRSMLK